MGEWSRREVLRLLAGGLPLLAPPAVGAEGAGDLVVTCFYQFGRGALDTVGRALPNGPGFVHYFCHSHPGMRPHPDTAAAVHALGSSFRYAPCLDVHKYPGWQTAPDDRLRAWALEFRAAALDTPHPADAFGFNEMPTTGPTSPALRAQVARWLRHLHDPGDGRRLPCIFFFTERNVHRRNWPADAAPNDFWQALDETCELVVGEHYHSVEFAMGRDAAALARHLFDFAAWLEESGQPAARSLATRRYLVLHSSYYGPGPTGWAGADPGKHDPAALERYFRHLLAATRASPYGRRRIGFGPLAARALDTRVLEVLARVLREDLGGRSASLPLQERLR